MKLVKGLEHLPFKKRPRAGPGEEKAQGNLIHVYKRPMEGIKRIETLSLVSSDRTRQDTMATN